MPVEVYALPAQPDAFDPLTQSMLVSDRASIDGTGYRTVQEIFEDTLANLLFPAKFTKVGTSDPGTLLLPGIYLDDDTDSGLSSLGANTWALSMGGTEVMRWTPALMTVTPPTTLGAIASTFSGNIIAGVQDGTAAVSGQVGQRISSVVAAVAAPATATPGNVTTISLEGDFDVSAAVVVNGGATGLTANSTIKVSINTVSATNGVSGSTMVQASVPALIANGIFTLSLPKLPANPATATTYYLVIEITYAAGTPTVDASFIATRVR